MDTAIASGGQQSRQRPRAGCMGHGMGVDSMRVMYAVSSDAITTSPLGVTRCELPTSCKSDVRLRWGKGDGG